MPTAPRPVHAVHALLLAAGAACGGCQYGLNNDTAIGHGVTLSAISGSEGPPRDAGADRPVPSLTAMSRENWGPTQIAVPVDGVEHQPTYSVHARYTDQLARQRGEFPTEATALDMPTEGSNGQQALEALAEPFYSALDIIEFIPRAVGTPPWTVVESPLEEYERGPREPGDVALMVPGSSPDLRNRGVVPAGVPTPVVLPGMPGPRMDAPTRQPPRGPYGGTPAVPPAAQTPSLPAQPAPPPPPTPPPTTPRIPFGAVPANGPERGAPR